MVASAFTAPHVTEFLTVDVTPMMELRDRLRRRPEFADVKLDPVGLRRPRGVPGGPAHAGDQRRLRRQARGDEIVVKDYVHLGHRRGHAAWTDRAGDQGRRRAGPRGYGARALHDLTGDGPGRHTHRRPR